MTVYPKFGTDSNPGTRKCKVRILLLCLYRARNKITYLSIPTHAQFQRHRLKFSKNHFDIFSATKQNHSDFSEDIVTP